MTTSCNREGERQAQREEKQGLTGHEKTPLFNDTWVLEQGLLFPAAASV